MTKNVKRETKNKRGRGKQRTNEKEGNEEQTRKKQKTNLTPTFNKRL